MIRAISSRRFSRVEVGLVRDLGDVEVEDVEPVLLRRRAEPDVAAHPAGADQGRVEPVERHVGRADEVDLVAARAGRRQPQRDLAEPPRHDVGGVEERVEPAREDALGERRVVDPVHDDEQLVQGEPAALAHAGEGEVEDRAEPRLQPGRSQPLRRPLLEHPLAPAPRLEDQVAAAGERAVRAEEEVVGDVRRREAADRRAAAERLAAHADRVDLVDEDDALAAPLAGEPLRLPREVADDDRVDADERLREARSRGSRRTAS